MKLTDPITNKIQAIAAVRKLVEDAPLHTDPNTGEIVQTMPTLLFAKHLVEQIMILGASENSLDFQHFTQYTGNIKTGLTRSQAAREAECPEKGTIEPYPVEAVE